MSVSPHDIARVLSEALPHMQRYDEEIVVVKYGGHAMGEEASARSFCDGLLAAFNAACMFRISVIEIPESAPP